MLKVIIIIAVFSVLLYGALLGREAKATEQLAYVVKQVSDSGVELREYEPFIVAEIDVEAENARQAASVGFRPLAKYIFGGNVPKQKIAMTAPVTTQVKSGEKIAMTAPVTTLEADEGVYTVQFSMPAEWTMESLPTPENNKIRLVQKPSLLRLAKKYRGKSTLKKMADGERLLTSFAAQTKLTMVGPVIWAGYSSPFVPRPLRKWEMLVTVER